MALLSASRSLRLVTRLDVNVRQMFDVVVVAIIIPCMSALSSTGRASRSSVPCVGVGSVYVHRDQIQLAVMHAALDNHRVGKLAYSVGIWRRMTVSRQQS